MLTFCAGIKNSYFFASLLDYLGIYNLVFLKIDFLIVISFNKKSYKRLA